ncbi:hypothetical protein RFI_09319 [Reticulomyxa filosa]|uniref:CFAP65 seventh Ig-like domain-containing protein n=1 Tax=Reticulomyxa filosa TaxID=46433 RepID=X6NR36_RETFI|nr:hypothetical protein RFI_09319 [Reticulomyxa filosa]|eukprot:ETO27812.1 hypothetical protein RFI_09319 [Reticulomyxa filosa]
MKTSDQRPNATSSCQNSNSIIQNGNKKNISSCQSKSKTGQCIEQPQKRNKQKKPVLSEAKAASNLLLKAAINNEEPLGSTQIETQSKDTKWVRSSKQLCAIDEHNQACSHSTNSAVIPCFISLPSVVDFKNFVPSMSHSTELKLLNTTHTCQRFNVVPPKTQHFSVNVLKLCSLQNIKRTKNQFFFLKTKYPGACGVIAPGLHATIVVTFTPDKLRKFQDVLTICTGSGNLTIPLNGIHPEPQLTLSTLIELPPCLVNDYQTLQVQCKNEGSFARFRIVPFEYEPQGIIKDFEDVYSQLFVEHRYLVKTLDVIPDYTVAISSVTTARDTLELVATNAANFLQLDEFEIAPAHFCLDQGESVLFQITFHPKQLGKSNKKFIILCDDGNSTVYDIVAMACNSQLALKKIGNDDIVDGNLIGRSDICSFPLVFENTCVGSCSRRSVTIENTSSLPLAFEWKFSKDISDCVRVNKANGLLSCGVTTFEFEWHCFFQDVTGNAYLRLPLSGEVLELVVHGKCVRNEAQILPSNVLMLGEDCLWLHPRLGKFQIQNISNFTTHMKWSTTVDSSYQSTISQNDGKYISTSICEELCQFENDDCLVLFSHSEIILETKMTLQCAVSFVPKKIGNYDLKFFLAVKNDFGILNFGEQHVFATRSIVIVNESATALELTLEESREDTQSQGWEPQLQFRPSNLVKIEATTDPQDIKVLFFPKCCQTFASFIQITVMSPHLTQGSITQSFFFVVAFKRKNKNKNKNAYTIHAKGEVQAPMVKLSKDCFNEPECFLGVAQVFKVEAVNSTNLKADLCWQVAKSPSYEVEFLPLKPHLTGGGNVECTLRLVPKQLGPLDVTLQCQLSGSEKPLELRIQTLVKDLKVSLHRVIGDSSHLKVCKLYYCQSYLSIHIFVCLKIEAKLFKNIEIPSIRDILEEKDIQWMEKQYPYKESPFTIDFGSNVEIYCQSSFKLVLRNHTASKNKFNIDTEAADTSTISAIEKLIADSKKTTLSGVATSSQGLSKLDACNNVANTISKMSANTATSLSFGFTNCYFFPQTNKKKHLYKNNNLHFIFSFNKDEDQFSNANGKKYASEKKKRERVVDILHGRGAVFAIVPSKGLIEPWGLVELECYCFNDMCGTFTQQLNLRVLKKGTHIDKLSQNIPIDCKIGIVGSPLSFGSCTGISFPKRSIQKKASSDENTDIDMSPRLDWMPQLIQSGTHVKNITVNNNANFDMKVEWSLIDMEKYEKEWARSSVDVSEDGDIIYRLEPYAFDRCIVQNRVIKPNKHDDDICPFSISPQEIIVKGKQSARCTILFDAKTSKEHSYYSWLFPNIFVKKLDFMKMTQTYNIKDEHNIDKRNFNNDVWVLAPKHLQENTTHLKLRASTIRPQLLLDKSLWGKRTFKYLQEGNQNLLTCLYSFASFLNFLFYFILEMDWVLWAIQQPIIKNATLFNNTSAQVSFSVEASPSEYFRVKEISSSPQLDKENKFSNLIANDSIQFSVMFNPPSPKDKYWCIYFFYVLKFIFELLQQI